MAAPKVVSRPIGVMAAPGISVRPEPAGYEWLFVLAGELLLVLGEREVTLRPGDAAEFDTAEPHWFGPNGDLPAEILHIFGRQGERARVRARPANPLNP